MRVTLLGFALPDAEFASLLESDPAMPVQTQRFGVALADAMRSAGVDVSLISTYPAVNYPHNRRVLFRSRRTADEDAGDLIIGFVNLPIAKHASRAWGIFKRGPDELRRTSSERLLVHGVHTPWLMFGAFASRRLGIPAVAVLTDPPNVPHAWDNVLTRFLKRIDTILVKQVLGHFDGVVALTRDLADDFAPGLPCLVMEGIAPNESHESSAPRHAHAGLPTVLYAGGLSAQYGVQLLLDAHEVAQHRYRLVIAGRGEMSESLALLARERANLDYLGMVEPVDMPALYAQADALVNPRPPNQGFTGYSFPSKILEYLLSGVPVVSTRLEGIPDEYWRYMQACEPTVEDMNAALFSVFGAGESRGVASRDFVLRCKTARPQGRRLVRFLREVGGS